MRKYDELYDDINTLLSNLRSYKVIKLVNDFYLPFGNEAPGEGLQRSIDKLYDHLDWADPYKEE